MSQTKKRKRNKLLTIDRIKRVTLKLIKEKGYAQTRTNKIAELASVNISLIYKYFPRGKPEILRSLSRDMALDLDTHLSSIKSKVPDEILYEVIMNLIKIHHKDAPIIKAINIAYLSNEQLFQESQEYYKKKKPLGPPFMSKVLDKMGLLIKGDLYKLSGLLLRLIDNILHRHVLFGNIVKTDEELASFLTELILGYIKQK